jgi:hypothetical protein
LRERRRAPHENGTILQDDVLAQATVGCVPIGDDAIEEVFYFAAEAGRENTSVIIAPYDMRKGRVAELEQSPLPWYGTLCDEIAAALRSFVHDFPD